MSSEKEYAFFSWNWPSLKQERVPVSFLQGHLYLLVVWLLSRVRLFGTPWTVAHQAPLSMGQYSCQARILERVAISSSRGSSWPKDGICISCSICLQIKNRIERHSSPKGKLRTQNWLKAVKQADQARNPWVLSNLFHLGSSGW